MRSWSLVLWGYVAVAALVTFALSVDWFRSSVRHASPWPRAVALFVVLGVCWLPCLLVLAVLAVVVWVMTARESRRGGA